MEPDPGALKYDTELLSPLNVEWILELFDPVNLILLLFK
jgi:hypothetical protein